MRKATRRDKGLVTGLLSRAFDGNMSVNYIIPQDSKREQRIAGLMDYSFELCHRFGEIYLSDNDKGCALLLYPHLKKTTWAAIWLDVKLLFNTIGIGRIFRALGRESKIKAFRPKVPMAYLWFIGVNPLYQREGIGSNLLKEVLAHAEAKGLPVYLETSTKINIPWYRHFGFRIYDELVLTYVLHFLEYRPIN